MDLKLIGLNGDLFHENMREKPYFNSKSVVGEIT
jgi:hypothetical protein